MRRLISFGVCEGLEIPSRILLCHSTPCATVLRTHASIVFSTATNIHKGLAFLTLLLRPSDIRLFAPRIDEVRATTIRPFHEIIASDSDLRTPSLQESLEYFISWRLLNVNIHYRSLFADWCSERERPSSKMNHHGIHVLPYFTISPLKCREFFSDRLTLHFPFTVYI